MVFDEIVTTTTQDSLMPQVQDAVLNSNVICMRLMADPKPWTGETFKFPIKHSKSTTGGSYDGYDTFVTTKQNTRVNASFSPKGFYQTVTLSGMEINVNDSAKVLDLIGLELESAQQDAIDSIGDMIYGDGTGNSNKDFTGLVAAVDDGTNVATYGGLSRTTYTGWKGNYTASSGTLSLSKMATMYDSCTRGSEVPTLIVTTETLWTAYEALLQPTVQASYQATGYPMVTSAGMTAPGQALVGHAGFVALTFRGTPIVKDEKCTSGYMYFLNEKHFEFRVLADQNGYTAVRPAANMIEGVHSQAGTKIPAFYWSGWLRPVNQHAITGNFIMNGDLICKNPRLNGVLRGLTA